MFGIAIAYLALAPAAAQQACENNIVGTWRLVSAVSRGPGGLQENAPYGRSPSGMLIYTADGHMSVMISYGDRKPLRVQTDWQRHLQKERRRSQHSSDTPAGTNTPAIASCIMSRLRLYLIGRRRISFAW